MSSSSTGKNGLLGRPVEWCSRTTSRGPISRARSTSSSSTVDKVDLIMGPYATANILSAMGSPQRYNKVLIHHTFGTPSLAKYEMQFPAGGLAAIRTTRYPSSCSTCSRVRNAAEVGGSRHQQIPFGAFHFPGARAGGKKRGLREAAFLEWISGNRYFGPIAARLKDAKPDFVWVGASGSRQSADRRDPQDRLYAAAALSTCFRPGPLLKDRRGKRARATTFERHPPFTTIRRGRVHPAVSRTWREGRIADSSVENQSAISYSSWQTPRRRGGSEEPRRQGHRQWLRRIRWTPSSAGCAGRALHYIYAPISTSEAEPERQVGRRLAEGIHRAGRRLITP